MLGNAPAGPVSAALHWSEDANEPRYHRSNIIASGPAPPPADRTVIIRRDGAVMSALRWEGVDGEAPRMPDVPSDLTWRQIEHIQRKDAVMKRNGSKGSSEALRWNLGAAASVADYGRNNPIMAAAAPPPPVLQRPGSGVTSARWP